MNTEEANNAVSNIISVTDKITGEKVLIDDIKAEYSVHNSSSTKTPVWRIIMNGKSVLKINPYRVSYKCVTCDKESQINMELFVRRLNNKIFKCNKCKEQDETKKTNHSQTLQLIKLGEIKTKKSISLLKPESTILQKIVESEQQFQMMDDVFKDAYFKKHLTFEEFELLRPKIVSFGNYKFSIENFRYIPAFNCSNGTLYAPRVFDSNTDLLEKIDYIEYKCDSCQNNFINRDLYIQKGRFNVFCRECLFVRDIFKLRITKNCIDDNILYQSLLELKFIKACNELNIPIYNGPVIPYTWNDSPRRYRVDFMIPELHILIEIKDDHIWHNQQIENGKWDAKVAAAKSFLDQVQFKEYIIIFPKTFNHYLDILKDRYMQKSAIY